MFVCSARMHGFVEAIVAFTLSKVSASACPREPRLALLSALRPIVSCVAPNIPPFACVLALTSSRA